MKTRSKEHLNALISPRVVDFDAVRRGYDEVGAEIHSVGGIAGPFKMLAFLHSLEERKGNASRWRADEVVKETFAIVR